MKIRPYVEIECFTKDHNRVKKTFPNQPAKDAFYRSAHALMQSFGFTPLEGRLCVLVKGDEYITIKPSYFSGYLEPQTIELLTDLESYDNGTIRLDKWKHLRNGYIVSESEFLKKLDKNKATVKEIVKAYYNSFMDNRDIDLWDVFELAQQRMDKELGSPASNLHYITDGEITESLCGDATTLYKTSERLAVRKAYLAIAKELQVEGILAIRRASGFVGDKSVEELAKINPDYIKSRAVANVRKYKQKENWRKNTRFKSMARANR